MYLERLSIGNILSKLPAGSGLRQKVVQIAQNAITEGVTEYVQQYPEEITNPALKYWVNRLNEGK